MARHRRAALMHDNIRHEEADHSFSYCKTPVRFAVTGKTGNAPASLQRT